MFLLTTASIDVQRLYRIYTIPSHDKHQCLRLQFIILLMMGARSA